MAKKLTKSHIQPLKLDRDVTFSSVGGLEEHIKCLREMVLFPLMYPDLFKRFNTRPPKGVLFHGPPGTGKTLLARALAQESSQVRGKKVAFFMRKGADIMSKWYGESEKQLKMLFQQANKMRPSIIFFDEVDALAPARGEGQAEACAGVVAALLVEMDGLWDRGDVIVIGATNRPDCLDPALRRSGRFDRELFFPPPSVLARRDILAICTRHWLPRPSDDVLDRIAQSTSGYVGSDLKALCSEAVLRALRRMYPQVYDGDYHCITNIDTRAVEVTVEDMMAAKRSLLPTGARYNTIVSRTLPAQYEPLLRTQVDAAASMLKQAFPLLKSSQQSAVSPSVFLVSGHCAETLLAPALLAHAEHCSLRELSISTLHSPHVTSQERAIISIFSECRREDKRSCVIFIPNVAAVWESLKYTPGQKLLLQLWRTRAAGDNVLLLATCNVDHRELPEELKELFPMYQDCVYRVRDPNETEVLQFLKQIIAELSSSADLVIKTDQTVNTPEVDAAANSSAAPTTPSDITNRKRRCDIYSWKLDNKRAKYKKEYTVSEDDNDKYSITELERIFEKNVTLLCRLGLEALIDMYLQLSKAMHACTSAHDRMMLPKELHAITIRYLKLAKKSELQHYSKN